MPFVLLVLALFILVVVIVTLSRVMTGCGLKSSTRSFIETRFATRSIKGSLT
ncbi:MAG: hypothetical protein Pg6C_20570 [Treponemataceae bacterium]|nr:MAG: hypothetical protein Pg6C_20570 [Treponemataceae bacterium]